MDNKKICDCPFTDWCHEGRQWVREQFRIEGSEKNIEACDFYKVIKERIAQSN